MVTLIFLSNSWPGSSCSILVGMKANLEYLLMLFGNQHQMFGKVVWCITHLEHFLSVKCKSYVLFDSKWTHSDVLIMWIKAKTFVFGNLRICFCADFNTLDHPMMIISTNTHSLFFLPCVCSVARRATMPTNALKAILLSLVDSNLQPSRSPQCCSWAPPPRSELRRSSKGEEACFLHRLKLNLKTLTATAVCLRDHRHRQ